MFSYVASVVDETIYVEEAQDVTENEKNENKKQQQKPVFIELRRTRGNRNFLVTRLHDTWHKMTQNKNVDDRFNA